MNHDDIFNAMLVHARERRRLPDAKTRRILRERAGLTQAALAEVLEVDRATVCRWESGEREPRAKHLARYVEVLDRLAAEAMRQ